MGCEYSQQETSFTLVCCTAAAGEISGSTFAMYELTNVATAKSTSAMLRDVHGRSINGFCFNFFIITFVVCRRCLAAGRSIGGRLAVRACDERDVSQRWEVSNTGELQQT